MNKQRDLMEQLPEGKYGVLGLTSHQRHVLSSYLFELEEGLEAMNIAPDIKLPMPHLIRNFNNRQTLSEKLEVLNSGFHYFEEDVMRFTHMFHMIVTDLRSRVSMDEHGINPNEMTMEQLVGLLNYYLGYSEKGGEIEDEDDEDEDFEA
jgi:hypothetical protein